MNPPAILQKYQIIETIQSNINLNIYRCYGDMKEIYRVHHIKDKNLIKIYLSITEHLSPTLPYIESFLINGELYLVFKDYSKLYSISSSKFNNSDKIRFLITLIAKLALDSTLPNFIKYTLIKSDNLKIDSNNNLCFNVTLDILNPSSFDSIKSTQKSIALLCDEIFDDFDEILPFIQKCETLSYHDYLSMLIDIKAINESIDDKKEPWLYEKLLIIVMWVKTHFKKLVMLFMLFFLIGYSLSFVSTLNVDTNRAYAKSKIGIINYEDPYSEKQPKLESISIYIPEIIEQPEEVEPQAILLEEYITYVVQKGEYLFKISQDYYGDRKFAYAIAFYNGIENPDFLPLNYPLKLPNHELIQELFEKVSQ